MSSPLDHLEAAVALYRERNESYGLSFDRDGEVMKALFPNGFTIKTAEEFSKLFTVFNIVMKLMRYIHGMEIGDGGHKDSADDLIVYSAILAYKTER